MSSFFDEIARNNIKSVLLMACFLLLFALIIYFFVILLGGGILAFILGLIVVAAYAAFTYFRGHKVVLKLSGAKEADRKQYGQLYGTVEGLALAAQVPMPKVYIINDPSPNAFATGRNKNESYVCVTSGLLSTMNNREMQGVLSHEMSHIYDNDINFMMIAVVFAGVIGLIAALARGMLFFGFWGGNGRRGGFGNAGILVLIGLVIGLLAPAFALLLRLAISRNREYMADANGARMIRDPAALAGALAKIKDYTANPKNRQMRNVNEVTASLYFSNPLSRRRLSNLFSTHPPIDERIRRLKEMY
jgi:heat shock protein HtpX